MNIQILTTVPEDNNKTGYIFKDIDNGTTHVLVATDESDLKAEAEKFSMAGKLVPASSEVMEKVQQKIALSSVDLSCFTKEQAAVIKTIIDSFPRI